MSPPHRRSRRYNPYSPPSLLEQPVSWCADTAGLRNCTSIYRVSPHYLVPSPSSYAPCSQDVGIPSWNLLAAKDYPLLNYTYNFSPNMFAVPPSPTPSSVYSFCSSDSPPQSTTNSSFSPQGNLKQPEPTSSSRRAPVIVSPVPQRGSKPVVLDCELPDFDEDLSHAPYIRPPKRKRRLHSSAHPETPLELRRSTRLLRERPRPS